MHFDLEKQRIAWGHPPTEHVGNVAWPNILSLDSAFLYRWAIEWSIVRYRSYPELLDVLGPNGIRNKRVFDFGSGLGIDALAFAHNGNLVSIGDINAGNLMAASRIMLSHGMYPEHRVILPAPLPPIDVFYSAGVLHHMPSDDAKEVLLNADKAGARECYLLLYTRTAWQWATGTEPDPECIADHPMFTRFVRAMDPFGDYSEWYDEDRLEMICPPAFKIDFFKPCNNRNMAMTRLIRR